MNEIDILKQASGAVARLAEHDRDLRAQHAAALKARRAIDAALEPVGDIIANMNALVDAAAARWVETHAYGVTRAFSRGLTARADGTVREKPAQLYDPGRVFGFDDLCGLAPEVVKARCAEILRAHAPANGIPMGAREAALTDADRAIERLETLHTTLVDEAASLTPPIVLELLPAVKARRDAEAARARAEAAVNEAAGTPRVGVSQYLAATRADRPIV
jgi:hypothetical protein